MMELLQWLGPSALLGLIGAVIKFSGDYSKVKTILDVQKRDIERIEKTIETNQAANKEQHEVFYQNQRDTLELKSDMKHLITSVDNITKMLERRGENR